MKEKRQNVLILHKNSKQPHQNERLKKGDLCINFSI